MKNTVQIILLHSSMMFNKPLRERIGLQEISDDVISVTVLSEAFSALSPDKKCIIVTDSLIASTNRKENADAFDAYVKKIKAKNPECKIILYTTDTFGLPTELFDFYIKSSEHNSDDALMKKLEELSR